MLMWENLLVYGGKIYVFGGGVKSLTFLRFKASVDQSFLSEAHLKSKA
jgi:hypothetical protein